MRAALLGSLLLSFVAIPQLQAEKVALVGGTVLDPATENTLANAVVIVDGNTIEAVGPRSSVVIPPEMRRVECNGKWILPGYIDTHVHFFQSGDLFARPDAADFTKARSYADEVRWTKSHLADTFARYLRSGITGVVDVGGPFWNFEVRNSAHNSAKAPRVSVAGPLISSVSRSQLDLGDPPIVEIKTPEEGRAFARKLAERKPDYIKIWYIVSADHPVESFRPVVEAVVAEAHAQKIRVAVHATELAAARAAVEAGADLLVHSVTDQPVDASFVDLLKNRGTILCPTLVVFERYGRVFADRLNLTPEEKAWGNPEVTASLGVSKMMPEQLPERVKKALADPEDVLARIHQTIEIAQKNLKTLSDAGVTIAAGTDAGNIGTIHGPALFREFQLMREAGLTPWQILRDATANAAKVLATPQSGLLADDGKPRLGRVAPGQLADLIVLNANPAEDIAEASSIDAVMKDGVYFAADDILKPAVAPRSKTMTAAVAREYGDPGVLKIEEVPIPEPKDDQVLVRVIASGVNPADPLILSGRLAEAFGSHLPLILGYDVAGVVEKAGARVQKLKVGDAVYGYLLFGGGWAQYCLANENEVTAKPRAIDFADAAAVPLAALTAWQALIDAAHLQAGQTVLIHGGSGGVGSFAIQLAKEKGAKVIATASTANQDLLRQLGADQTIDYTKTKFEDSVRDVDVVIDSVGRDTLSRSYGVVRKGGVIVSLVGRCDPTQLAKFGIRGVSLSSHPDAKELDEISRLIDAGKLKPVVSNILPLSDAVKATEKAASHHTRGKVVMRVADDPKGTGR